MAVILVIGSGGREHAIACKLASSINVSKVYVSPGNGGMCGVLDRKKAENLKKHCKIFSRPDVSVDDFSLLASWCKNQHVDLVVIGSEVPLANGICDLLSEKGIACFGPTKNASLLESSKSYAKDFMLRNEIPTARYQYFTTTFSAVHHINTSTYPALVVKASGLAAGKGVIVCDSKEEACESIREILEEEKFGSSGEVVVVEELLHGEEFSILCFTDGSNIAMMPPIQDHKRVGEGDIGANSGGMGAYGPCPQISEKNMQFIKENVLQRAVDGMRKEGKKFVGVLYAGIMISEEGPKVLEFNCRFGDPEAQVLLSLLNTDLYEIMKQCVVGELHPKSVSWKQNVSSVCIVLASKGYPGKYEKGKQISGVENVKGMEGVEVFEAGTVNTDDNKKVTSGGRVLSVCTTCASLSEASNLSLQSIEQIRFEGAFYRRDIGWRGLEYLRKMSGVSYESSGVSIKKGNNLIHEISSSAAKTSRKGCSVDLGGFGGLFDLAAAGYSNPILVSGTDGVGTKLLLAQKMNNHSTIGQDLVAMCVNDILTHNAEPLYFLDYFACGRLNSKVAKQVITGIAKGCQLAGCALIGGETAEMPGMYSEELYDLAGFAVGAYDKNLHTALPRKQEIIPGDLVIGISSTGLHSNGFSLVRSVLEKLQIHLDDSAPFKIGMKLGDSLLTPTAIYSPFILPVLRSNTGIKAVSHITGGGIIGNLARVLPQGLGAVLDAFKWDVHPVFGWLSKVGNISSSNMLQTFNCGIGLCLVVDKGSAEKILEDCLNRLKGSSLKACLIGKIENRKNENVTVQNMSPVLASVWIPEVGREKDVQLIPKLDGNNKANVAVLISGTGTNLQALIDHSTREMCNYRIVLVISNKPDAGGLRKAADAGIARIILDHKPYSSRKAFDQALNEKLIENGIQVICLAGFMRLLSPWFTSVWEGRIINIHPSLLPAFKGMNAVKQALESGARITGCTAHFVTKDLDAGAIIAQAPVNVEVGDDVASLTERVKKAEHITFPRALDLVASRAVSFDAIKNSTVWKAE